MLQTPSRAPTPTTNKVRLGMLTPSSNTMVEPVTTAMLAQLPAVTAHFSRFRVTQIAASTASNQQFDEPEILRAAELLSHAKADVIAWNGTSAAWLGFDRDERLCASLTDKIGVPACTSVLAFREIFERTGARRIGLITPYDDAVQKMIVQNWAKIGLDCSAERHLGLNDNFAFAAVAADEIAPMARGLASENVDAIAIVCTNIGAAPIVEQLEAELGIPVYDSVAVTLWKCLLLTGVPPVSVQGWGRLFTDPQLSSVGAGVRGGLGADA
jgi:maleate isomerase